MIDWVYYLTIFLFLDIPLLYFYINLRPPIIFCLFPGVIYLSLGIYISKSIFSASFVTVSELFCCDVFENFVILLPILLPIKSPAASAVELIALFEAV